jgi:hypothetical protein
LRWVESYLLNRKQCVRIGSESSAQRTINIGVPQGSNLAPILFLLYINDFPNAIDIMSCILFADDTTVSISNPNDTNLISIVNDELCNIYKWTLSNRLSLNVKKNILYAIYKPIMILMIHPYTLMNSQ